jgi:predicted flap endonuclease-1-like 5' DNA nuclease
MEAQTEPAAAAEPVTEDAPRALAENVEALADASPDLSLTHEAADRSTPLPAIDTVASEQPVESELSMETASTPELPLTAEAKVLPSDDFTLVASIDADLAGRLNGLGVRTFAEMAAWTQGDVQRIADALALDRRICKENWIEQAALLAAGKATTFASQRPDTAPAAAASPAAVHVEPAGDVAMPSPAPEANMSTTSASTSAEAAAADSLACPADAVPAQAPAATPVISFEPRRRKEKAGSLPATSASVRPRRRLATKVAACILALLAGATALVVADRTAVGGVLPWIPPLPSYLPSSGVSWPFVGERRGVPFTAGSRAVRPIPGAVDDTLLGRYREVWPTGS